MAPNWSIGAHAVLVGLNAAAELNGEHVVVIALPKPPNERLGIEVTSTGRKLSVKPANLQKRANDATDAAAVSLMEALVLESAEPDGGSIIVNVGGIHYTTTEAELTKITGSFFEALLRQRDSMASSTDGEGAALSIQRNGHVFKHVLTFLRNWPVNGDLALL